MQRRGELTHSTIILRLGRSLFSLSLVVGLGLNFPPASLPAGPKQARDNLDLDAPCPARIEPFVRRGDNFLQDEQFEQAAEVYSLAIKKAPDLVLLYRRRADAYVLMKKPLAALADWNKIVTLEPRNAGNYLFRGRLFDDMGKDQEALADYNRSVALGSKTAYKDISRVYEREGKYEKCIGCLNIFLTAIQPLEQIPFLNDRARIYQKLGRRDLAEADRKTAAKILSQTGGQNIEKYPDLVRSKNK